MLSFSGSPTDVIQLKSISLSPDPPKPGQDLTVTVVGTAQQRVEVSFVNITCRKISFLFTGWSLCQRCRETRPYQTSHEDV